MLSNNHQYKCNITKSFLSVTLKEVVKLNYYWTPKTTNKFNSEELKLSPTTVVDWFNFGQRKTTKADESKDCRFLLALRLALILSSIFFETVEKRDAPTLLPLIQKWVAPGSIIHTDYWKGYSRIVSLSEGYTHLTVNHSENFVDPDTGCHIQGIESRWHAVKGYLPRCGTHTQLLPSYFAEYMLHKKYLDTAENKFLGFMKL